MNFPAPLATFRSHPPPFARSPTAPNRDMVFDRYRYRAQPWCIDLVGVTLRP